jgi:hypothetical protein
MPPASRALNPSRKSYPQLALWATDITSAAADSSIFFQMFVVMAKAILPGGMPPACAGLLVRVLAYPRLALWATDMASAAPTGYKNLI